MLMRLGLVVLLVLLLLLLDDDQLRPQGDDVGRDTAVSGEGDGLGEVESRRAYEARVSGEESEGT